MQAYAGLMMDDATRQFVWVVMYQLPINNTIYTVNPHRRRMTQAADQTKNRVLRKKNIKAFVLLIVSKMLRQFIQAVRWSNNER